MTTLNRPRGLIDYESWNNIERGRRNEPRVVRLVRPKTIVLFTACIVMAGVMAWLFAHRTNGSTMVQHDRNPVAVTLSDGSVRNAYTVKLLNKAAVPHEFTLRVEGVDAAMTIIGNETGRPVTVPADGSESLRVTLTMARPQAGDVRFVARDSTGNEMLSAADRFVTQ